MFLCPCCLQGAVKNAGPQPGCGQCHGAADLFAGATSGAGCPDNLMLLNRQDLPQIDAELSLSHPDHSWPDAADDKCSLSLRHNNPSNVLAG